MKYKALILDLDGTLYHQLPVRICMAVRLAIYYALRPGRIREAFMLRKYRQLREERAFVGQEDFGTMQVREAARLSSITPEDAERLITQWMIQRPLMLIKIFRRRGFIEAVMKLQESGTKIIVYSDYPVDEKLRALNLRPDYAYCSNDRLINCMKPDPEGLRKIIDILNLSRENILYIGDRDDKDGLCAQNAGVDYLDVRDFVKIHFKEIVK